MFFQDPFKLTPLESMAEIADKLTRNEILSSNEVRQKMGFKPSKDPKADQLVNSNIAQPEERTKKVVEPEKAANRKTEIKNLKEEIQNGEEV